MSTPKAYLPGATSTGSEANRTIIREGGIPHNSNSEGGASSLSTDAAEACAKRALVFEGGQKRGTICADHAAARELTVIDLSDDWLPFILRDAPELGELGKQPYAPVYRALASGKLGKGPTWEHAREDRFFELYGIPPTLSLVRTRLDDEARHACHALIDNSAVQALALTLRQETAGAGKKRQQTLAWLKRNLEAQRLRQGLASIADLAPTSSSFTAQVARYEELRTTVDAIHAIQSHLICDRFLDGKRTIRGTYDWRTAQGVGLFQRIHMVLSDETVGGYTREAFLVDSQEHDFRAALRVLRERVIDATGLIEDGSAREEWGTVLGRYLDAPSFRTPTGHKPLADGAPDLISQATEAAATALGWTSPDDVRRFFDEHVGQGPIDLQVALRLPKLPAYHGPNMQLRAVVDRGDVWYEFPGYYYKGCVARPGDRHPTLTVYATDGSREVPLMRWHTTIGGWNKEKMPGGWEALRYKESDVGPRVWRDLVVAPAWFPPDNTPDSELVERTPKGWKPKYDTLGPSYRSAYGLAMLVHHKVAKRRGGEEFYDNGIRVHGSSNMNSIIKGCSHGCHRLFNHLTLRLATFLLRHRPFVRHGAIRQVYERVLRGGGRRMPVRLTSRGYQYELTPPVEVVVTEGRIRGRQRKPSLAVRPIPARK